MGQDEKSIWNQFRKAENQELNNGRLAMMGITGGAWWGRATAATGRYRMLHVFGSFEPPISMANNRDMRPGHIN